MEKNQEKTKKKTKRKVRKKVLPVPKKEEDLSNPNPDKAFIKVKKSQLLGGRPTDLTPEVQKKICNYIYIGSYPETAAVAAGVTKVTYLAWLKRGNKVAKALIKAEKEGLEEVEVDADDIIYYEFLNAVDTAVAQFVQRELGNIDKVANGDDAEYFKDDDGEPVCDTRGRAIMKRQACSRNWQASAWRLEKRMQDYWGKNAKQEIEFSNGAAGGEKEPFKIVFVKPKEENKKKSK